MVDFKALKKSSGNFDKLTKALAEKASGKKREGDDRFWSPTIDKAGNGYAVIRFLPAPGDEDLPFVQMWDHGFKGPGGWYIENSLTTLGLEDPVSEFNSKLWNSVDDDKAPERKQARDQKRRLSYISNIYVVKDSANPDNEGKVFLYKYGKKIFEKLNDLMNPRPEEGEEPVNPFDMWTGANFKLKIRKVDGYRNYDKSEFDDPAPLLDDDKELEKVWKSEYSLTAFHDKSNFKSYEALKARLAVVLGDSERTSDEKPAAKAAAPKKEKEAAPPKQKTAARKKPVEDEDEADDDTVGDDEGEDGEGLEYFTRLANETDDDE